MAGQQANAQRMMRPVMTNSLGLRHLLQQVSLIYKIAAEHFKKLLKVILHSFKITQEFLNLQLVEDFSKSHINLCNFLT